MNDFYFSCLTCKTYHNAGHRWCRRHLEVPGVITQGAPVSVEALFRADEYWNSVELEEEDGQWLRRDLPKIRAFLEKHQNHALMYTMDEYSWTDEILEWMDEEDSEYAHLSPRLFVEKLGFTEWDQVIKHVEGEGERLGIVPVLWWDRPDRQEAAKRKFEALVRQR